MLKQAIRGGTGLDPTFYYPCVAMLSLLGCFLSLLHIYDAINLLSCGVLRNKYFLNICFKQGTMIGSFPLVCLIQFS